MTRVTAIPFFGFRHARTCRNGRHAGNMTPPKSYFFPPPLSVTPHTCPAHIAIHPKSHTPCLQGGAHKDIMTHTLITITNRLLPL